MLRSAAVVAVLALTAGVAQAQTLAATPCQASEHRQMDFWVGEWDLEFDNPNGTVGRATNRITRDEFGDCVVAEHFEQADTGYVGASWSVYDPQTGQWRQTWVDNAGTPFFLVGGPVEGQPHLFELRTTEPRGAQTPATRRMIWEQVTEDSLVWRWQTEQTDGSWADAWVLRYRRRN